MSTSVQPRNSRPGNAASAGPRPAERTGVAEAARYGVLRRLAPALKHDMVVHLQAVAMMAEVLNARLEKGMPDPADLHKRVSQINRLAREAVMACLKVTDWIQPNADESVRLCDGVTECVALQQSSLNFRGFLVRNDVPEGEFEVSRVALRNLLAASLLTLTDSAPEPCVAQIEADVSSAYARLTIRRLPREDAPDPVMADLVSFRQLDWTDVQALAACEGVDLMRTDELITMLLPRLVPSSPLQIAPI